MKSSLLIVLVCILISFLNPTASKAEAGVTTLPIKTTTDPQKPWTITFNQQVDPSTINEQTIYIVEGGTNNVEMTMAVSKSGDQVILSPKYNYKLDTVYTIVVTNKVTNHLGKSLKSSTTMKFNYTSKNDYLPNNWESYVKLIDVDMDKGSFHFEWSTPPVKNILGYHAYWRMEGKGEDGKTRAVVDHLGEKVLISENNAQLYLNKAIEYNTLYGIALSVVYEDGEESNLSRFHSELFFYSPPPAGENQSISSIEKAVLDLTNAERRKAGLSSLQTETKLMNSARQKSADMAKNKYFSHTSPTYGSPFEQMKAHGITYRAAAENIARGYTTAEAVVTGWMNSPGHRKNILTSNYTHIGIGFDENGNYWTQQFIEIK